jgi:UDP-glucose 4-epimerase
MLPSVPIAPSKGREAGGWQGPRILVIGCGFIGSHVVAELATRGRPPVVLTRSRPVDETLPAIAPGDLHLGDAGDAAALDPALEGVDHVVYTAGGLLPAASQKDPERDAELTLRPLRTLLEALSERPETQLSYVSSGGTVYGEPDQLPVPETAPTRPHGSYGELHLACEREISRHQRERGMRARILRCSTVYGERQWPDRGQGAVPTFLHRIGQGEPIRLYGGEGTIRDYVYAGDVAAAIVGLIERDDPTPVLNLGSGEGTSLLELVRLIERRVGRQAVVEEHPERDFDVHEIVLDVTRLRQAIGFEPTPLGTGIERTHRWLRENAPERV